MRPPRLFRPLLASTLLSFSASAQSGPEVEGAPGPKAERRAAAPTTPPPPYSLPWQLRPAPPVNVLRWDTSIAGAEPVTDGPQSLSVASLFLGSYKFNDHFAGIVRWGVVHHEPPTGPAGTAVVNPALGVTYGRTLDKKWRLNAFLGATLPVGMGGGNTPTPEIAGATRAGVLTRSAMDNALFAVNDFTVFPGVSAAYVANGWTVQLEATVLQLTRVRGEAVQADASRTNFTSGLHVGYFLSSIGSLAAELRYQRWLSTPAAVAANPKSRDNLTVAFGPRFHLKLSDTLVLRPGVSVAIPLDAPMSRQGYRIVQLDLPLNY